MTATSFVRGFTRALAPEQHGAAGSLSSELDGIVGAADVASGRASSLTGAQALDSLTLQIRLSAPDAEFLVHCGSVAFSPIPSDGAIAAVRPSWGTDPIGNGPFELGGPLAADHTIALAPNPLHAPRRAKTNVALIIYSDLGEAYTAWRAGRLDWTAFPQDKTAEVRRVYRSSSLIRPTAGVDALVVPLTAGPTANIAVREALSLAVDRRAIAHTRLTDAMLPANGLVPPRVPGSAEAAAAACLACAFDPGRARALLAQAGVTMTGVFPIVFDPAGSQGAWARAVAADLTSNLSIHAEAVPVGSSPGGGAAAVALSRQMRYPAPDDFLVSLLGTGSPENASGYTNPALDAAIVAARGLSDPAERAAAYGEAERMALGDLPLIPLFWQRDFRLARVKDWKGLAMDLFGDPTLASVSPA